VACVRVRAGRPQEALVPARRAVEIFHKNSDPEAANLGRAYSNLGEVFNALGRYTEGEDAFQAALKNLSKNFGPTHPETAFALHGMGEVRLAQGSPGSAARFFEDALRIRLQPQSDPTLAAESQFGLARALSEERSPKKARALAMEALTTYRREKRKEQRAVEAWLTDHHLN
jgi:tetratricopeptide (TPR) repeat protein